MQKTKDPNRDAQNMGGPGFHPDIAGKKKASVKEAVSVDSDKGAILDEDQVPPL